MSKNIITNDLPEGYFIEQTSYTSGSDKFIAYKSVDGPLGGVEIVSGKRGCKTEDAARQAINKHAGIEEPVITLTRHSWNHISRVCYKSFASKPLSQKDEMAYKKAITANQQAEYEAREYNGRLYRVYQTILEDGKAKCCSCPANKPCRHLTHYEQVEAARGQSQDERETFGLPLDEACKSAEIAKRNMQLTPEEGTARDAALAAARAESDALLAQIDAEVQQVIEQEQAAPQQPKSEQARFADLPLSENERKEARLASLNEEFPVGMVVPAFHGAGVLVEGGVIVEPVATNFENIDFVVVEQQESGERVGISCSDLRCLIREGVVESVDEEEKYQKWTDEELTPGAGWMAHHEEGERKQREMSRLNKEMFNAELKRIKAEQEVA